jgi:hypothetical protein
VCISNFLFKHTQVFFAFNFHYNIYKSNVYRCLRHLYEKIKYQSLQEKYYFCFYINRQPHLTNDAILFSNDIIK